MIRKVFGCLDTSPITRIKTLLHLCAFLELYKPLSQKLFYFNKKYESQIKHVFEKIQFCINDHNDCLKMRKKRAKQKSNVDEFEIKWNEIVNKFIQNKIYVEIIKVPIEKSIKFTDVNIRTLEILDREEKYFRIGMMIDEVYFYLGFLIFLPFSCNGTNRKIEDFC